MKTNTPKRETKDESQTNGSYKIKEIIIKIMEYTPIRKSEQSNRNKVRQIDLVNKGNQELYLPVNSKTKAQTGKHN